MYFDIPVKRLCENQNWISEKWLILGIIIKVFSIHIFHFFFSRVPVCLLFAFLMERKTKTEDSRWKKTKHILLLVVIFIGKQNPQHLSQKQINIGIIIYCNTSPFLTSATLQRCAFPGVTLGPMHSTISAFSLGQEKKTLNHEHTRVFSGQSKPLRRQPHILKQNYYKCLVFYADYSNWEHSLVYAACSDRRETAVKARNSSVHVQG